MDVRLYWTDGRSSWPYAEFLCGDAKWPNRYCASTRPDWHGVLGLSAYTITSKKDFSFMRNFLFAGLIIVIVAALINIFVGSTVAHLAISSVSALVFSGFILFDTSRIVRGEETNYISATISMYLNILNLFTSLLSILGIMNNND